MIDRGRGRPATAGAVLAAISFSHLINDTIQQLLPAVYPLLKSSFALSFAQVGLITLTQQITSSLIQPAVGLFTDKRPTPYALVAGMSATLVGLVWLSLAPTFSMLLVGAGLMGVGSAIFHPEASRVARMASGRRYGLAQSVFQLGGNVGSSLGPLLARYLVLPYGQLSIAWCSLPAFLGISVLWRVGGWYKARQRSAPAVSVGRGAHVNDPGIAGGKVTWPLVILAVLIFSKYFYLASLNSYYMFYLISRFHVSVRTAQIDLFLFLSAVAAGTMLGGPIGDRFGRKYVIWGSIFGVCPFTLALPYANLFWTPILTVMIGLILASAFSAIVVYAQELLPGRVGLVSGVFFGFAFGVAGIGAAVLGAVADHRGIEFVYRLCAFLPLLGVLAAFLPDDPQQRLVKVDAIPG